MGLMFMRVPGVSPRRTLAVPPLFTCLWFTDPRARVCRPHAHSSASRKTVAIEVGTGCAREGAGRMPGQANPAQGNPNSMPQIRVSSKLRGQRDTPWSVMVRPRAQTTDSRGAANPAESRYLTQK